MRLHLQLILSTLLLTALIWVYADRQGHEFYTTTVPVTITPTDPGSGFVIRVEEAGGRADTRPFKIEVRGPKSATRDLERDDRAGQFRLAVKLDSPAVGIQSRDLFTELSRAPELRERGLTLQSVSPQTITFEVDRLRNIDVQVQVDPGVFEKELIGKPLVDPETVTARVLESKVPGGTLPPVKLPIDQIIAGELEKPTADDNDRGINMTFPVQLRSTWPGLEATFQPASVKVTVSMKQRTVPELISPIPLQTVRKARDASSLYQIEWEDKSGAQKTQALNVLIPIEKRGRLKPQDVLALLIIEDEDLPKPPAGVATTQPLTSEGWITRAVRFVLPPGFEDVKLQEPLPTVKFRVIRQPDAPSVTPADAGLY